MNIYIASVITNTTTYSTHFLFTPENPLSSPIHWEVEVKSTMTEMNTDIIVNIKISLVSELRRHFKRLMTEVEKKITTTTKDTLTPKDTDLTASIYKANTHLTSDDDNIIFWGEDIEEGAKGEVEDIEMEVGK